VITVAAVGDTTSVHNGTLKVPQNAKYFARTIRRSSTETVEALSIKGYYSRSDYKQLAMSQDVLPYSAEHKREFIKDELWSFGQLVDGRYTENGVDTSIDGYGHTGLIDISRYDTIQFLRATSDVFSRYFLDADFNVIETIDYAKDRSSFNIRPTIIKPKNAKYFVANVQNPTLSESTATLYGDRAVDTSDFQRVGSSGDAAQGWATTDKAMQTQRTVEVSSPHYPDVPPLKIISYGRQDVYAEDSRTQVETALFKDGWSLCASTNLSRPNPPADRSYTKNLLSQAAVLWELGMEGFSIHVTPKHMPYRGGKHMAFKVGGYFPRSSSKLPFNQGSMTQSFVPYWQERTDGTGHQGWAESSNDPDYDETIPSNVQLRQSAHFKSPNNFKMSYTTASDGRCAWDRTVAARGELNATLPSQAGDKIDEKVYSVVTGTNTDGSPIYKDVAKFEVIYNGDSTGEAAQIVFKVWNNDTGAWVDKVIM